MIFRARNRYFDLDKRPLVMGILNMTPDSFSDGGKFSSLDSALIHCEKMISQGADMIDIGGESSRPGSDPVSSCEETDRILDTVRAVKHRFEVCVSVDTYKPDVARAALSEGADMINNIFGINNDPEMLKTVSEHKAGYCIMHTRGIPGSMQNNTEYAEIIKDVSDELKLSVMKAEKAGIGSEYITIDPGIGFGKDVEGNIQILKELKRFSEISKPVLIGTSRKSFIGHILGTETDGRLYGTIASNVIALTNGASIFRVHDVIENRQAVDTAFMIINRGT